MANMGPVTKKMEEMNIDTSTSAGFQPPEKSSNWFWGALGSKPSEAEVQAAKEEYEYKQEVKRLTEEWANLHPELSPEAAAELKLIPVRERTEFKDEKFTEEEKAVLYRDRFNADETAPFLNELLSKGESMREIALDARVRLGLGAPKVEGPQSKSQASPLEQFGASATSAQALLFHNNLQRVAELRENYFKKNTNDLPPQEKEELGRFKQIIERPKLK